MNKLPHTPQKRAQKLIYITKRNKKQAGAAQAGAGVCRVPVAPLWLGCGSLAPPGHMWYNTKVY